uniref:hypothetical protein n=2 Tax=Bacillus subtilis TaxID=1423 RepID=UPI0025519F74
ITDKLSAIGCLKGVLIPVSKTGVSPTTGRFFHFLKITLTGRNHKQNMFHQPVNQGIPLISCQNARRSFI